MFVWFVVPLATAFAGFWTAQRRKKILAEWGQLSSVQRLLPPGLLRRRRWVSFFRVMGLVCIALALAGPLIGSRLVEFHQKGLDVFIAVDTSLSMQAQDFQPNRMAHAKLVLGHRHMLFLAARIGEAQVDELDVVVLDHFKNVGAGGHKSLQVGDELKRGE